MYGLLRVGRSVAVEQSDIVDTCDSRLANSPDLFEVRLGHLQTDRNAFMVEI